MSVVAYVLAGIAAFYLLAPLPNLVTDRLRHGRWPHLPLYGWRIWPFHEGFSVRLCTGRRRWSDWFEVLGPWYRSTFRWWFALVHVWRSPPPACSFCAAKALGLYSCSHAPVSLPVCQEHLFVLKLWPDELVAYCARPRP